MSTLTSLVKSSKRKIIKTKAEEPAERGQKLSKSTESSASKRGFLGRPDPGVSRGFLGRPDPSASQNFLGRPDPEVSQDATKLQ